VASAALFAFAPRRGLGRGRVAGQAAVLAVAAILAVNAGYFFRHAPPEPFEDALARSVVALDPGQGTLRAALSAGHHLLQVVLPADFVAGIGWQLGHAKVGHPAGLLGGYSQHGWWYYFPVAFALKTPLPVLLLTLAGLAWGAARLRRAREGRVLVLLLPPALFTLLLMFSTIDIGVRYYIPAYPFFFMLAGAMLDDLLRGRVLGKRFAAAVVALSLVWAGAEAARAYPDHMTYMNQLASGAPRWWYLSDSNVEWGDDVRDLAEYLRARGETKVRAMTLGGFLTLHHYGVDYLDALAVPKGPPPRYTAIGASFLNGSTVPENAGAWKPATDAERVNVFDEYRRRTPERVFGGSIYLFREDGP
jgi:hypothetical protein